MNNRYDANNFRGWINNNRISGRNKINFFEPFEEYVIEKSRQI